MQHLLNLKVKPAISDFKDIESEHIIVAWNMLFSIKKKHDSDDHRSRKI